MCASFLQGFWILCKGTQGGKLHVAKGDLGKKIGAIVAQKQLKKAQVARLLGITPQKLGNWTSGANDPPHAFIPALAEALDVPIDTLYTAHLVETVSRLISTKPQRVRDYGLVPGTATPPTPARWIEVLSELNLTDAKVVTVASDLYGPRFPRGRQLVFRPTSKPTPGKYHLMATKSGETYLALVDNRGKVRPLDESRSKPSDTVLGILIHEFSSNEEGIGP